MPKDRPLRFVKDDDDDDDDDESANRDDGQDSDAARPAAKRRDAGPAWRAPKKRAERDRREESTVEGQRAPKKKNKRSGKKPRWESTFKTMCPGECGSRWVIDRDAGYIMARLVDSDTGSPSRVDVSGVDIGKAHVGICGLDTVRLARGGWPRVTSIALVNGGSKAAHQACDKLDEILVADPKFKWFRKCKSVYIEQQMHINPQAKQVAQGIRSSQRTVRLVAGQDPDVSIVSASQKYKVAQLIAPSVLDDEIRELDSTGRAGKSLRKVLGERDVFALMSHTDQAAAIDMIASVCAETDQLHDITDSVLLGLAGELLGSQRRVQAEGTPYGEGRYIKKRKQRARKQA